MSQIPLTDTKSTDYELIHNYLDYTAEFSEAPQMFHIFTLFSVIATLVGRGRYIIQGEDTYYPNLYTLVVAPSSLHKKTSTIKLLGKWLHRLKHTNGYIGHIGSPEGLFNALCENGGCATAYYSELGLLMAQNASTKYMGPVLEMLNDLYDCPDYYSRRLSGQLHKANNICFNMIAATQLNSLTKYVRESDLLSGFLPRFAVIYSDERRPHLVRRPPPNAKLQNRILSQLNGVRKATREPNPMDLTEAAWETFEKWAKDRFSEAIVAPPMLQPMYGRLETHALKLGIIVQLCFDPTSLDIDEETIRQACGFSMNILNGYRQLVMEELTFTHSDRKLKRVSDEIKNAREIAYGKLMGRTRYSKKELADYVERLHLMGKVKTETGPRGGKVYIWIGESGESA